MSLLTLITRKDSSQFYCVLNIHHKINLRSHMSPDSDLNVVPYYWYPVEFENETETVLSPYFEN
jgi:hypothetical protein